mmetsp:Transcript_18055/g.43415  ORF Transcript_18055/g.43415 Transcript_18055/m.43415 type:complete len:144 (+) Transcript_18055:118-549(+)
MPESLHSVVFNFINEALAIFIWPNFDKDALYAMGVGIVLGLVILSILTSLPGEAVCANGNSSEREGIYSSAGSSPTQDGKEQNMRRESTESVSIFQILNILVYTVLFSGTVYYLNRDYDDIATKWFASSFPREAETLGLHVEL